MGRDRVVTISCIAFTIAFLPLLPLSWNRAWSQDDLTSSAGMASITIILVALIETWVGFIKRSRSAWAIMFIIVSGWAFPVLVLPTLTHILSGHISGSLTQWISDAWQQKGIPRITILDGFLVFLMILALFLPITRFFHRRSAPTS